MIQDPLQKDTIVAIATPPGTGAIGIIRLSGSQAIGVAKRVWSDGGLSVDNFVSNLMCYGKIIDLSTGLVVDHVLAVLFRAPRSFTGEDTVEFHAHGNPLLLGQLVEVCRCAGARLAAPGEFSRRAFLNGKIDLSQAEAIADLIAATSTEGLRCAQEQLEGRLSRHIRGELEALTKLRAFVEATIDFPDEGVGLLETHQICEQVAAQAARLAQLGRSYHEGRLYKEGARVVLVGAPNAGKSSLFNALVGTERALVHESAGTTRDVVEETVVWEGIPIRVVDTAGLRALTPVSPAEDVETLGMARTRQWVELANLRIVVVDGTAPYTAQQRETVGAISRERVIVWCNKADLGVTVASQQLAEFFPTAPVLCGSAKTGDGLAALQARVLHELRGVTPAEHEWGVLTTLRHKEAVDAATKNLQNAAVALEARHGPELVAEHLGQASQALGRVVGDVTTEDLLGEIFSRFCIGK